MSEENTSEQTGATPDDSATETEQTETNDEPKVSMRALDIPVEQIQPNPYQSRRVFPDEDIHALATSITEVGLLEPILVRKISDSAYQLIAGEYRLRAYKLLNKTEIPCLLFDSTNADMEAMGVVENIRRRELSDYEIALAIHSMEARIPKRAKLAETLGLQREDMYRYFAFDALPEFIIEKLEVKPRLLSRSAAADIKHAFSIIPAEQQEAAWLACKEAIEQLEAGKMEQGKIGDFMVRKVKQLSKSAAASVGKKGTFIINDKAFGHYSVSPEHDIKLEVSANLLNDEQADAFINDAYNFLSQTCNSEQP